MTPHTYRPRTLFQIDSARFGTRSDYVVLSPEVIEAKWTRNDHLVADELTVTISWKEGGIDPRALKNGRGSLWLWDSNREDFNKVKHLRFTGICKKVSRRLGDNGWVVDITLHDYTTLFINNKPLKTSGMPEWSYTLQTVWERICDNTGAEDPANGKIISSVEALRDHLVFAVPELATRTLGEMEAQRFHAISKPTPHQNASSWDVWKWCVSSLGLISYIDKDECIVTNTTEHYTAFDAARAIYGINIHSLEEEVDTDVTLKGVLLKSFDPLTGRVLEAFYPRPGDERLKARRAAVRPKSEGGTSVTENEQSGDYEEFTNWSIRDQKALDAAAKEAYEERSRQEIQGSFKTAEMVLETVSGREIDIFDLRAGESVAIQLDPQVDHDTLVSLGGEAQRVRYLVDNCNYDEDVALLIVRNINVEQLNSLIFHITSLELSLGPSSFEVEIKFHNLITIS